MLKFEKKTSAYFQKCRTSRANKLEEALIIACLDICHRMFWILRTWRWWVIGRVPSQYWFTYVLRTDALFLMCQLSSLKRGGFSISYHNRTARESIVRTVHLPDKKANLKRRSKRLNLRPSLTQRNQSAPTRSRKSGCTARWFVPKCFCFKS